MDVDIEQYSARIENPPAFVEQAKNIGLEIMEMLPPFTGIKDIFKDGILPKADKATAINASQEDSDKIRHSDNEVVPPARNDITPQEFKSQAYSNDGIIRNLSRVQDITPETHSPQSKNLEMIVRPSVVDIVAVGTNKEDKEVRFHGSGCLVKRKNGKYYVLTCSHIFSRDKFPTANYRPFVKLANGRSLTPISLHKLDSFDIALIELKEKDGLKAIKIGQSNEMRINDYVMAVGSPFGQDFSFSVGKINHLERYVNEILCESFQFDAAINFGNSGGPLVNEKGELVAVVVAEDSNPTARRMAYAVKISPLLPIINDLIDHGNFFVPKCGISVANLSYEEKVNSGVLTDPLYRSLANNGHEPPGVLVSEVRPNSRASGAHIHAGDIILKCNGHNIEVNKDLDFYLMASVPSGTADLDILRNGQFINIKIKTASRIISAEGELTTTEDSAPLK